MINLFYKMDELKHYIENEKNLKIQLVFLGISSENGKLFINLTDCTKQFLYLFVLLIGSTKIA